MKKFIYLLLGVLFLIPGVVLASSTYDQGLKIANKYIYDFPDYSRYIKVTGQLPFAVSSTNIPMYNADFTTGGFLNEKEYARSLTSNGASYLAPGIGYWLVGRKILDVKAAEFNNSNVTSGVRVTEFTKHDVKVKGSGTKTNPWYFTDGYTVKIGSSDQSLGTVTGGCEHVQEGGSCVFTLSYDPLQGINTNNCKTLVESKGGTFTHSGNTVTVRNVKSDISCVIDFGGNACLKVKFANAGGSGGMADKVIYYKYGYGWFSDSLCLSKVSAVYRPTKTGNRFEGYKFNSITIIDETPKLVAGIRENITSNSNEVTSTAVWTPCPAGTYLSGNSCLTCPAGTYSGVASTSCTNCPAGTYSGAGAGSCTNCPAGTYSGARASSCTNCEAGTYSGVRAASCTNCAAGTYSGVKAASCTNCPAGTYSGAKAASCTNCPAGTYSGAKAASCTNCAAGTYQPNPRSSSCLNCTAGTYSGVKATSCTNCPAGTYSGAKAASCTNCPAGTYQPNVKSSSCINCVVGSTSAAKATACTACQGKTTTAAGSSSCNGNCPNAANVATWKTATWNTNNTVSNLCTINTCAANYKLEDGICKIMASFSFRYTGTFRYKDGNAGEVTRTNTTATLMQPNWQVKFLSSGTLTVYGVSSNIDVFLVGGGGGAGGCGDTRGGGGGGGGFTTTKTNIALSTTTHGITIGGGGGCGGWGATSTAFGQSAGGGAPGSSFWSGGSGGYGGSGGGGCFGGNDWPSPEGRGGSNGSSGSTGNTYTYASNGGYNRNSPGGSGCSSNGGCKKNGSTCYNTRAFCESSGELFAGGGAGADHEYCAVGGSGGGGGSGQGGWCVCGCRGQAQANTGGGGAAGGGGSGIVIIRNKR